jgi:hypothetical protein
MKRTQPAAVRAADRRQGARGGQFVAGPEIPAITRSRCNDIVDMMTQSASSPPDKRSANLAPGGKFRLRRHGPGHALACLATRAGLDASSTFSRKAMSRGPGMEPDRSCGGNAASSQDGRHRRHPAHQRRRDHSMIRVPAIHARACAFDACTTLPAAGRWLNRAGSCLLAPNGAMAMKPQCRTAKESQE